MKPNPDVGQVMLGVLLTVVAIAAFELALVVKRSVTRHRAVGGEVQPAPAGRDTVAADLTDTRRPSYDEGGTLPTSYGHGLRLPWRDGVQPVDVRPSVIVPAARTLFPDGVSGGGFRRSELSASYLDCVACGCPVAIDLADVHRTRCEVQR